MTCRHCYKTIRPPQIISCLNKAAVDEIIHLRIHHIVADQFSKMAATYCVHRDISNENIDLKLNMLYPFTWSLLNLLITPIWTFTFVYILFYAAYQVTVALLKYSLGSWQMRHLIEVQIIFLSKYEPPVFGISIQVRHRPVCSIEATINIRITRPCILPPLTCHFYKVKGAYIIFLIFALLRR